MHMCMQVDRLEFVQGIFKLKQAESFQRRKAKGTLDHKVEGIGTKLQTVGAFSAADRLRFTYEIPVLLMHC